MYTSRSSSSSSRYNEDSLSRAMTGASIRGAPSSSSSSSTPRPNSTVTLGVFNGNTAKYSWAPLDGQSEVSRPTNSAPSSNLVYFVEGPLDSRSLTATSILPMIRKKSKSPVPQTPSQPLNVNVHKVSCNSSPLDESFVSTPSNSTTQSTFSDCSDDKEWLSYAVQSREPGEWRCRWKDRASGYESKECHYTGKKQLVKRHIENVHLKYKPFPCPHCDQRFGQKTSLNVHISAKHTKSEPHICNYPGCDKRYNDPARLHRHKVDVHGYIPKAISRKNAERQAEAPARAVSATYIPYMRG